MSGMSGASRVHQSVASQADVIAVLALVTAIDAVTALIPDAGAMLDLATIEAVTALLPDAGALTSLAQATLLARHDQHFHNVSRSWGAVAVPDETNAIESNVDNPFVATSGNNTWGAAIPILGTADNPVLDGMDEFDCREILVTDLDSDTTPWKFRIIWGTGTSGDAITAEQWTEEMVTTNAVPGNRAGGTSVSIRMPHLDVGIKLWAQAWNDTLNEALSFFWAAHGYPYPPP